MRKTKELTKDERIKKELTKLKKIFENIDSDRKAVIEKLINNAAWMSVTLEDLMMAVNTTGPVDKYIHGENQYGYKESPCMRAYNTLIKNYNTTIKQLLEQLPKDVRETDDFADFLKKK